MSTCRQCGGSGRRATAMTAGGRELERHERRGTPCQECRGLGSTTAVRKGEPGFDELLGKMRKGYLHSRFPNLTGYAYEADMVSIEEGREITEDIISQIVAIDPDGPHGYEAFKMKGESEWRSVKDSEDFPQPSDEPLDQDDEEEPMTNPKKNAKRGPGKFVDDLDAALYTLSLDGPDEQVGDSEDFGWYGLMRGGDLIKDLKDAGLKIDENEADFLEQQAGCIIHENSQGFVAVDYYEDEDELEADWKSIEEDAEEFYGEGE